MGAFVTLAMEALAFIGFVVVIAVMPYVRRKRGYWTSRGVRVPAADRPTLMSTLPGVQLDEKHLAQYYRDGKKSMAAVVGLYDAGRACALACDACVAADAVGNDGFAEVDNDDGNNYSLIPSTVNPDAVIAVLPAMNECVGELVTSLEAVANRQLTIVPWTEVRKCAATVVATCVYGQPMIDSRIKSFAGQCDKVLLSGQRRSRPTPTDYFAAYDLSASDPRGTSTDFKRLLRLAAEESEKISTDVADKQVRLDMFEFVTGTIEPTAELVTAALYELACDKEIQNRLREHLDSELDEHQQQVTIDQLDRLYYLENILRETLRKYPLMAAIRRKTTKPYTVPGSGGHIKLEPGTLTVVPVHAIHHDDEQFFTPETFNPQRFPEQLSSAYMPNGSGPQSYISKHFVGLEAKLIIAMLICRYEVHINSTQPGRSPDPFDATSFASVRMKLSNRSSVRESTMAASLRKMKTDENDEKKFLFF